MNETAEAIAEVLSCTYTAGAGRAMAFGLPTSRHFLITYQYRVGDDLHTAQFASEKAMPQGMLFPVRYDPDAPLRHSHEHGAPPASPRKVQLIVGIAGSVILSLLWWLLLHFRH